MKKYEAIGVIDVQYFTVAAEVLDQVCKTANVEFLTSENYLGGRLVSIIIGGGVSDITAAVEIAKQVCQTKPNNPLKMAVAITNPHPEILKYMIPSQESASALETVSTETKVEQKTTKRGRKPKQTKNESNLE